jgi:hypothetical protein
MVENRMARLKSENFGVVHRPDESACMISMWHRAEVAVGNF